MHLALCIVIIFYPNERPRGAHSEVNFNERPRGVLSENPDTVRYNTAIRSAVCLDSLMRTTRPPAMLQVFSCGQSVDAGGHVHVNLVCHRPWHDWTVGVTRARRPPKRRQFDRGSTTHVITAMNGRT